MGHNEKMGKNPCKNLREFFCAYFMLFQVETQEVRKNKLPDNSPASSILSKAITNENISLELNANAKPPIKDIKRFPEMPANWGPKARAKVNK